MTEFIPDCENLSVEEIDEKLEEAVLVNERSHCHISFYLLAMNKKGGHEKYGFVNIFDYTAERFGYSYRMTGYMLGLARKVKNREKIAESLNKGEIPWTKAYKIASVATDEDEEMWLEAARSLSVRQLDRKIKDNFGENYSNLRFCLSEEQAAVVEYAMEICRRVSGAELSPEQCLEYMAGEFLATWAQLAEQEEAAGSEQAPESADVVDEALTQEESACPDNGDLPSPAELTPSPDSLVVFARDHWQCSFPGCSARSMLHDHHIEFRSEFGKKRKEECDDLSNRTAACAFHHRLVHAGIVSVTGEAPDKLEWERPKKLEKAIQRFERKRLAQEEEEARRRKMNNIINGYNFNEPGLGLVPYGESDEGEALETAKESNSIRKTFSESSGEADLDVKDDDDEVQADYEEDLDEEDDGSEIDLVKAILG